VPLFCLSKKRFQYIYTVYIFICAAWCAANLVDGCVGLAASFSATFQRKEKKLLSQTLSSLPVPVCSACSMSGQSILDDMLLANLHITFRHTLSSTASFNYGSIQVQFQTAQVNSSTLFTGTTFDLLHLMCEMA